MGGIRGWLAAGIVGLGLTGCTGDHVGFVPNAVPSDNRIEPVQVGLYIGSGNPYLPGPLHIRSVNVVTGEDGAPAPLRIHAPVEPGAYAIVVFFHGLMGFTIVYDEILRHLASHGFVVVAPQMYTPSVQVMQGDPTALEEAELAGRILDWLPEHLSPLAGVSARTDLIGLAGHSRGGKVAWLVLSADPNRALAYAGVDPVDGVGALFGGPTRAVVRAAPFPAPTLVIGSDISGVCTFEGDNHEQFYAASAAPAWHVVALGQGHGDMIDALPGQLAGYICPSSGNGEAMRRLTAGLLVAFFRGTLQGDLAALTYLSDTSAAPGPTRAESK